MSEETDTKKYVKNLTSDIEKYLQNLKNFTKSSIALTECWEKLNNELEGFELGTEQYPTYLPSFDEFVSDICNWERKQNRILKDYIQHLNNGVKG